MKASTAQSIASLNALLYNGGTLPVGDLLKLYTGSPPASVDLPATGTLLSSCTQFGTYSTSTTTGSTVSNTMTPASGVCYRDTNAAASGTAGYFRITNAAGVSKFQGSVGTTSSFELQLNTTAIIAGQIITILTQQISLNGLF